MSNKAIVLFLIIAAGLVVAALLLPGRPSVPTGTPTGGAAPTSQSVPAFDPSGVISISVRSDGAPEARTEKQQDGSWIYRTGKVDWPAAIPEEARSALASLAEQVRTAEATAMPASFGPRALVLGLRDGAAITIRPSSAGPLGGKIISAISSGKGDVPLSLDAATIAFLTQPGPSAWRVPSALPGVSDAARLTISDAQSTIVLARVEGKWGMRRPITARTSEQAVAGLISALGTLRVLRFEDALRPDLAAMGLHSPRLTIAMESDLRTVGPTGEPVTKLIARELYIGGPADLKGDEFYAAADPDGSIVMILAAATVNAISTSARNYLAPTATAILPRDIFMFSIRNALETFAGIAPDDRAYRRDGSGWVELQPGDRRASADAQSAEGLLEFFSVLPGVPEPAELNEGFRPVRHIELFDQDGAKLDDLAAGFTPDGVLAVRAGNMVILYRNTEPPDLLALPAFDQLPPAPAAPEEKHAAPGAPVSK